MISLKNKAQKFVVFFIPSLILWFSFYHYIYKIDYLVSSDFDSLTIFSELLSNQSNFILQIFGLSTSTEIQGDMVVCKVLDYEYTHGVWIGEPCNGIKIFGVFIIFILCFSGKAINKLWFIPSGIFIIHFLNILRISILTYIAAINPNWLNFNHNITFQVIIYGSMFGLWLIWIKKFSNVSS